MIDEVKVTKHVDGRRDVLIRYEQGWYRVVVVDEYGYEDYRPRQLWPRSRAILHAKSVAKDEFI
jgi:hypothetical protein